MINLRDVVKLEYGYNSQAYVLGSRFFQVGTLPWNCVTLVTTSRTYDFNFYAEASAKRKSASLEDRLLGKKELEKRL